MNKDTDLLIVSCIGGSSKKIYGHFVKPSPPGYRKQRLLPLHKYQMLMPEKNILNQIGPLLSKWKSRASRTL